ncbi:MAG TPA: FtsX-like permease family protein, partial [Cyclobacteriaceae bacterium]|nr:FtsX-like permease family protein [Cyclobacteriaceae bacterium]
YSTTEKSINDKDNSWNLNGITQNYVYVLLPSKGDPENLQASLSRLSELQNNNIQDTNIKITMSLQPLNAIVVGNDLINPIGPTMISSLLWILGAFAVIILISACFNYTNLSIAQSLMRSKEVGIRKVIGAGKFQIFSQFICESVVIALVGLVLSILFFHFIRPHFLSLDPELNEMLSLNLSIGLISYFIIFAVITGFLAGVFPSIMYAGINAINAFKKPGSVRIYKNMNSKKVLIVFQYIFSLIFITITFLGFHQYKYFLNINPGFNTDDIINIKLQNNKPDPLVNELSAIPEVAGISESMTNEGTSEIYFTSMKYSNPNDSSWVTYNRINENYIPMHDMTLIAGRNFIDAQEINERTMVIVNNELTRKFNIGNGDLLNALGEIITVDGKNYQIIGIIKDFHSSRANNDISPYIFMYSNKNPNYVNIKIHSNDIPHTISKLEKAWNQAGNIDPFNASFYKDQIKHAFNDYSSIIKVIGFLAFLAIIISSLGLIGMVVYSMESRLKEIGIRKVLGANLESLIYLLGKNFISLILIACIIALPITFLFFNNLVLPNMASNRAPIGLLDMFSGAIVVITSASIIIATQTFIASKTNPSNILQYE